VMPDENPNGLDFEEEKRKLDDRTQIVEFKERRFEAFQWLDPLVVKGKLSDRESKIFAEFFAHLGGGDTFEIQFGEGEEKQNALKFLEHFLTNLPTRIHFGEIVKGKGQETKIDDYEMADKINRYLNKIKTETGRTISYTEAFLKVKEGIVEV
ncbi:MAG: hypothetical protein AB4290_09850, partial [Spirulina sp.]